MLVVITGKTCSGKDTVVKNLVKQGFKKIVTYTTRPKRKFEVDGKDYHFISEEDFKNKIKQDFFLEWTEYKVSGGRTWFYGSPRSPILEKNNSKNAVIILNPNGVDKLFTLGREKKISYKIIYIKSNRETIEARSKHRKDDKREFNRRIEADEADFCAMDYMADKCFWNNLDTNINDLMEDIINYIDQYD